ncbi:MAG: HAD hydrolase family protein [Phycisphaerales bacterium]|nr:HAD hydrolase family protein [Phycisphaerales bacterium]
MMRIRCLCLDVDGVMTDGRLWIDDDGRPLRAFHVHDGFAIRCFQRVGGVVMILTGKQSNCVAARARELSIEHIVQGSGDKLSDLRRMLAGLAISFEETAMIGDDWPDMGVMKAVGYPIAVANAVEEIKAVARYVTTLRGGEGAVREAIEHLLGADGRWREAVERFG